ncbi:MAG: translation initiation factor 1 [Paraglaciecola sp.]|jgi:translation initiation factor 1
MSQNRLVFSTATGKIHPQKALTAEPISDSIIRLRRETKGRKGKGVTTLSDIPLPEAEIKQLCTTLKKMCATGGAVKNATIEIQGDNRDKIKSMLEKLGYQVKLAGG